MKSGIIIGLGSAIDTWIVASIDTGIEHGEMTGVWIAMVVCVRIEN